jgi:hypothetical protein
MDSSHWWPSRVVGWLWVAIALAPAGAAAQTRAQTRAEQQFASYSFAFELGSGIYQSGSSTLQIYRLPFSWIWREPEGARFGVRFLLPVTLGFLDYDPGDLIEEGLPDRIDSLSFVPGVALEFPLPRGWSVTPSIQFGGEIAQQSEFHARLFSAGNSLAYRWVQDNGWRGQYLNDLLYAAVDYRSAVPSDDFLRWRNGVAIARGLGQRIGAHEFEAGPFAIVDWFADPPRGPVSGVEVPRWQVEVGVMLGTRPVMRWKRVPLPEIGLSYRFADDLSAWRLVFGAPL